MGEYRATVEWKRDGATFTDLKYSRGHRWSFDGGIEVPASSSPPVVRLPMTPNQAGRLARTLVVLHPEVRFGAGPQPSAADLDAMHHEAHEECFIANSVTTEVRCEPVAVASR